jgi:hypothetical protein
MPALPRISEQLEPMIAELFRLNQPAYPDGRGYALCASVESEAGDLPWIQLTPGEISLFYPGDEPPIARLAELTRLPDDISCVLWEPQEFATLEVPVLPAHETAVLVERVITALYDVPLETAVTCEWVPYDELP